MSASVSDLLPKSLAEEVSVVKRAHAPLSKATAAWTTDRSGADRAQ
jgi:hypothetical protein